MQFVERLLVVSQVFLADVIHVLLTEDHKSIETFLLDGLNEPFDEGVCVR